MVDEPTDVLTDDPPPAGQPASTGFAPIRVAISTATIEAIDITEASILFGADNLILRAVTSWGKSSYAAGICKKFDDKHIVIMVNIYLPHGRGAKHIS